MTKLELQNKIATIEKSMAKITNPAVLAIAEKNLKQAREQLAALEGAAPSPAPSGGGSELEKLYEQREKLKKGLQSSNAVVQKASKMALPKVEAQIAELEGASPAPAPARRMPKPKAETPEVPVTKPMPTPAKRGRKPIPPAPMPTPTPAKRGRKPKAEAPMPMPTPAKRGRKPKAEAPAEEKPKIKRGRKPKAQAPAEAPAVTPARRGRPALPKGAKSQEVSLNSLTKLANAIVQFCDENGIANPTIDDVRGILNILDKNKALKFAKGGKISRSGKYLSKWQIKQILTDGGMKIGSDEILSGVWLKKKVDGIAEMRMGGGVGYFAIKDDIIESRKSVRFGNRRVSSKNPKVVGVLEGKMVGNLMKVYDYDDEMWKVVNPDEWQQAYAEGGGVGEKRYFLTGYSAYASYDSYDEGEGENVSNWDDKISKTFSSKDDLINYISKNITYTDHTESDFDWEVGDGKYIVTSVLCSYGDDGGYYPASKSEIDQWKKGKKELYNVDYFIYVVAAIPTEYAKGGGLGTNFNIVYEKPNDDIAYKETINANSPREARNKFYAKHPTCTILSLSEEYDDGGGVGVPNAAWFVFQEKFPEAFEYYLKNNEYGVSKGDLMAMAYESTRNVDSAIPVELWKQVDDTMFYVYDYQNSSFGELVDLREKIKTSEVPVALSFVIDNEVFYGRNLPNELKNADFATALMYVYANRNVIDEFQIRPKRNVDNYAEGGGVGNFTLADYKANEEINNHSENALMLTKMYGTQEEINEVERLIRKGEREFGFSMEDYRRLYEISNKYYKHLVEASKSGGVGLKREKEKLRNLAYQLQNADEGWIRNNHSKFVQMQNDYKKQFKKVYGHSNYENPNNYAKGGGVGRGSFYKGQSILLHTIPSPKYERFLDIEIVIEKIDKNKIVKSFVRKTGEKVPFIIDDRFKKEEYAKGGGVDMYSKFDFNEKGNLSARINQKNYEIEYNDADGVYELFENGERVQSNKNVRTLMQFIQVSDVGNFREGQSVTIAEDNDNENYDDFRGKELVIYHKATNEKEHRGFDNSMEGQALYSFFLRETGEQVPFSCYDYELEQY